MQQFQLALKIPTVIQIIASTVYHLGYVASMKVSIATQTHVDMEMVIVIQEHVFLGQLVEVTISSISTHFWQVVMEHQEQKFV